MFSYLHLFLVKESLIFAGNDTDTTASSGMFELTFSVITNCISFGIIEDNIIERTDVFTITLLLRSFEVEFLNNTATIVINDNDSKTCIM